jgi:hypothetical protein
MYGINRAGKCAYRLNFLTTKALFYLHRGCPKMQNCQFKLRRDWLFIVRTEFFARHGTASPTRMVLSGTA